jgi:hypothetical protein
MPIHIEELSSEVTVVEGDLPLTPAQIDKLARLVIKRLEEKQRAARRLHEATRVRRHVAQAADLGE